MESLKKYLLVFKRNTSQKKMFFCAFVGANHRNAFKRGGFHLYIRVLVS